MLDIPMGTPLNNISKASAEGKIIHQIKVGNLISNFGVEEIEKALVKLFLSQNSISTENEYVNSISRSAKQEVVEEVNAHFEKRKLNLDLMTLEKYFESLLEENRQKDRGAYFTPDFLVDFVTENTVPKARKCKIIDPACGTGAFLIGAAKRLQILTGKSILPILEENVYGVDISSDAIRKSRILLILFALTNNEDKKKIDFNLELGNSLLLDYKHSFPRISDRGGFDVVIGNPPYAQIPESYDIQELSRKYETITDNRKRTNLYLPFIELMLEIGNKKSNNGCIIPLSLSYHSGSSFVKGREIIEKAGGEWFFSFYDRSPDSLFGDKIKTRNSIFFLYKGDDFRDGINSTKLIRWNSSERDSLFDKIEYQDLNGISIEEGIPKVSSELELKSLEKLRSSDSTLKDYINETKEYEEKDAEGLSKKAKDSGEVYFYSTAYNWLPVFLDVPESFDNEGNKFSPSSISQIECGSREKSKVVYAILNSKTAYWYWLVYEDGFHLNKGFIYDFPMNPSFFSDKSKYEIKLLGEEIQAKAKNYPIFNENSGLKIGNYNMLESIGLAAEVDRIIIEELSMDPKFFNFLFKRYWDHLSAGREDYKNKEIVEGHIKEVLNGEIPTH